MNDSIDLFILVAQYENIYAKTLVKALMKVTLAKMTNKSLRHL